MRACFITLTTLLLLGGCTAPVQFLEPARADTHLGLKSFSGSALSYQVATASGEASLSLKPIPANITSLKLLIPGMRSLEAVEWTGDDGEVIYLLERASLAEGVRLERQRVGFSLNIAGESLEAIRNGGDLILRDDN